MSIFELLGFILAVLGLLGSFLNVIHYFYRHFNAFFTISNRLQNVLLRLRQVQSNLDDLQLNTDFDEIQNMLNEHRNALIAMDQSGKNPFRKFLNATKWTYKSQRIKSQITEADNRVSLISSWLRNNASVTYEEHVVIPMEDYSVTYGTRRLVGNRSLLLLKYIIIAVVISVTGTVTRRFDWVILELEDVVQ